MNTEEKTKTKIMFKLFVNKNKIKIKLIQTNYKINFRSYNLNFEQTLGLKYYQLPILCVLTILYSI